MSAIRPRNADDLTPAELVTAAIDMDLVLEREPQLGDFGFGVSSKTPEERAADLLRNRDLIREPRSLAQFMAARGWLRQFGKIRALNRARDELRPEALCRGRHRLRDQRRFHRRGDRRRLHRPSRYVPRTPGSTSRPRRGGMWSATGLSGDDAP